MTFAPDWWPDWTGLPVVIIASGPSVKKSDVAMLRGKLPVLAIKENYDIAPWADVVYGCDAAWWQNRNGLQEYKGIKITAANLVGTRFDPIHRVKVHPMSDKIMMDEPGELGAGGNSGFQALNLSVQFGAAKIMLMGFDMFGDHWYGRNNGMGRYNPTEACFQRWRRAFESSAPYLAGIGVEVLNASQDSTIGCFRKGTVSNILKWWGL